MELTQELQDWFMLVARRSMEDFLRFTHSAGLTLPQMTILMRLYHRGPSDLSALVAMLQVTKGAVSQIVERMVQDDLIVRTETPVDRRVRQVALTDKGRAVVAESIAARQQWLQEMAGRLSPLEQQQVADALLILKQVSQD